MTEHRIDGGNFVAGTQEGDPGKRDYLHAVGAGTWEGKPYVGGQELKVDSRVCPGCLFPDAKPGKWPHTLDERCGLYIRQRESEGAFLHSGPCPSTCICGGAGRPLKERWVHTSRVPASFRPSELQLWKLEGQPR